MTDERTTTYSEREREFTLFTFAKNSSCCHALFTLNESLKYFMNNGGRVHCVALDAFKVFDKSSVLWFILPNVI